jgi:hypothetical protein
MTALNERDTSNVAWAVAPNRAVPVAGAQSQRLQI